MIDRFTRTINGPGDVPLEHGLQCTVLRNHGRLVHGDCRGRGCISGNLRRHVHISVIGIPSNSLCGDRALKLPTVGHAGRRIPGPIELVGGLPFRSVEAAKRAKVRVPFTGRTDTGFCRCLTNVYGLPICSCVGNCVCFFDGGGS